MNTTSFKVADNLYLVQRDLPAGDPTKLLAVPVDHIMLYDCSGSMAFDLPKIREQVKKKLPKMLGEQDTFSAIWFSGRGECGVLLEREPVATAKDLQGVNRAVDRWLKPVGMTGFQEPLLAATDLAAKLAAPGRTVSLTFMSDGCDNQWPRAGVLAQAKRLGPLVGAATFVEYGYYADRPLLAAMAEATGGAHIFAEDFDRYEPIMADVVSQRQVGGAKRAVQLEGSVVGGFAFALRDGELLTFGCGTGGGLLSDIAVPEGVERVFYLSKMFVGAGDLTTGSSTHIVGASYAAISLFATRMKPGIVLPLLKLTGNIRLINQFATCFGKQRYSAFMEEARLAAFDKTRRLTEGYNPELVPRDDAFTVLQLLEILQADEKTRLLLDHPGFRYSRIGRGRVDVTGHLGEEDLAKLGELTTALGKAKDITIINQLQRQIAELAEGKNEALKFVRIHQPGGYPILKLVYNENRPNVSILTKRPGTVDLTDKLTTKNPIDLGRVPNILDTFIYRSYAIVKDGLLNISTLPARVSRDTVMRLIAVSSSIGLPDSFMELPHDDGSEMVDVIFDLSALPTINRKMVKSISAKTYFETQYALVKAQAAQKVFNHYAKEMLPVRVAGGMVDKYGRAGAEWLKSLGIGDGFNPPHTAQAESVDFYLGKELKASLKGLGSLPTMKLAAEGKGGAGGAMMRETIARVETFLASDFYVRAAAKEEMLRVWLDGERKAAIAAARGLIYEIAQMTFVVVVGQTWFSEFASLDEGSWELSLEGGSKVACKVEMKDLEIHV